MFLSVLVPYRKFDSVNYDLHRQRQRFCKAGVCAWVAGMLFMCILIMSLMIVKVSSSASFYQKEKPPAIATKQLIRHSQSPADTTSKALAVAASQQPQLFVTNFIPTSALPIRAPRHNKLKQYMLMHGGPLQQYPMPMQMQLQPVSHAIAGETAYLLERAESAHEQPIYGTWLTKAKRPQPQSLAEAEVEADAEAEVDADAEVAAVTDAVAASSLYGDAGRSNVTEHHYERLPRRAATMTPNKSEIRDQVPRPPRLTSRQPSMLHRQSVRPARLDGDGDVDVDRNDLLPKPFHFPHEGPLPQEFSKVQPQLEQERAEVNNIQDILKHMHLGNMPAKTPQLIMMPTGLHVAGSFKNFKSSGIANFFRNKRQKKHLQLALPMQMQMPMPLHWMGGYQPPLVAAFAPHQRIAMDQFYPFKPRSPNDINLLAMQQQLQSTRSKNKKKRKNPVAHSPLLLQHSNIRPFTTDPFLQSYPYMFGLNQSQKSKPKRVPFKLNLDIYPVATPTKDYKAASAFTLEEAKVSSTVRPASAVRNPFADYYSFPPPPPSVSAMPITGPRDHLLYNGANFQTFHNKPSPMESPQSSNSLLSYQSSNPFYVHHHPQPQSPLQSQQQNAFSFPNHAANFANPLDPLGNGPQSPAQTVSSDSNPRTNQLLVHLNVFPKQTPLAPSTNPFYNSNSNINPNLNINRQSMVDQPQATSGQNGSKTKPRCKGGNKAASTAHPTLPIARSDNPEATQSLIDFEHPIVAAEVPNAQPLVDNKLEDTASQYSPREGRGGDNFRYNMDQLAAEAQAASLFRFPVEDLIQFHVDDAL